MYNNIKNQGYDLRRGKKRRKFEKLGNKKWKKKWVKKKMKKIEKHDKWSKMSEIGK